MPQPAGGGKKAASVAAAVVLRRHDQRLRWTFPHEEDADHEDHNDRDVQADVHEVLEELRFRHVDLMGQLRTGRKHAPRAGDNADRQIGLEVEHLGLEESDHGPKQLEQNNHEQQVVQKL